MKQYERMVKGLIYDPADDEIMKEQMVFQDMLWDFNNILQEFSHPLQVVR